MANEPMLDTPEDNTDDQLSFIRESLDDASAGGLWARALDRVNSRMAWSHALNLKEKLWRGGVTTLLFALTLFLLLGGPAAAVNGMHSLGVSLQAWLHPPAPQPMLQERGFKAISSPPGAYHLQTLSVAPVSGVTGAAWVCWVSPSPIQVGLSSQAHAYFTRDGGANWTPLSIPETAGQSCVIKADASMPLSPAALFIMQPSPAPDGSCAAPTLLLTTDAGATWRTVPWPLGPSDAACQFDAELFGRAIYLWSTTPLTRDTNPYRPPSGRILVTLDAGQTWTPADVGLDDVSGFSLVGFRRPAALLATIADVHSSGSGSLLMTSDDYGASWRSLGALPGAFPQVTVSEDITVTDHGGWGRIYVMASRESNGSVAIPRQTILATGYPGQPWRMVVAPPLPSGAEQSPQSREPIILGVGPGASLELERGIVESVNTPHTELSPSRRLWLWAPATGKWYLDPLTLPGNLETQGSAWDHGAQTMWVTILRPGVPPDLRIYRKTFTSNPLLGAT